MRRQCSIQESQLLSGKESLVKALNGNQDVPTWVFEVKQIALVGLFAEHFVPDGIDYLRANAEALFATMAWNTQKITNPAGAWPPIFTNTVSGGLTALGAIGNETGLYYGVNVPDEGELVYFNFDSTQSGSGWYDNNNSGGIYTTNFKAVWITKIRVSFSTTFSQNTLAFFNSWFGMSFCKTKSGSAPFQTNANPLNEVQEWTIPIPDFQAITSFRDKNGLENIFNYNE